VKGENTQAIPSARRLPWPFVNTPTPRASQSPREPRLDFVLRKQLGQLARVNGPIADRERPTISSDSDNDLAELAILLEIAMGLHHFAEPEGSIDDRPECARLESLGDVFNGCLAAGVVAAG
jgi:hypothetical protein